MTDRPVVPELEKILGQQIPVLDHGFVRVIDYMGDDGAVVQAARVSYGRGTRQVSEDRGLINYLMRNRHTSPFEMCEIKFHIKMPIFVARQWIRHRTANINEVSARYSVLDAEFYVPSPENLGSQSSENKQGRSEIVSPSLAEGILRTMKADAIQAFDHYDAFLSENLSRELARIGLPLSTYTQWYWKTNLHNLMHFLNLRADPHAQYEIRVYADVILDILRQWVPLTHEAFLEYRMNAATISATGLAVIRRMLTGEPIELAISGMSSREWDELMRILK